MGTRIKSVYVKLDLCTYIVGTWLFQLHQPVGQNSTERIQLCSDIQISIHKLSLETDFLAHILLFVLQIKVEKNTNTNKLCHSQIGQTRRLARFHSCLVSLYSTAYASSGSPPMFVGGTNRKWRVVDVTLSKTACWI